MIKKNIRFFRVVAVTGLLLFLFSCLPGHPVIDQRSKGIQTDPAIVYGVLPNGFQYILMENSFPADRVDIHLNVFAGSLNETDEQQGVAHYLEHMVFNGSTHFQPGELIEYFQSIGMDFGADANAHTSFFNTVYDLSLPDADQKHLEKAFTVIEDYAKGALLLETEIDRERGIILVEKRQRDSISYRTFKKTLEFELPGSLINRRFPIGIDSVLNTADQALLSSYYKKWYRPDNMVLVMVGDFKVSTARPMLVKQFSKLKSPTVWVDHSVEPRWKAHKGINAFYHYEPEAGSTDITIETISRVPFEAQTIDMLKKRTLNRMVDSLMQNRISRQVSQQTVDFSEGSVFSGSFLHHVSVSAISATCEPDKWQNSLGQIESTLRQGLDYGFTKKELERVKSDFISALEEKVQQAESRKSPDIARQILNAVHRKGLILSPAQRKTILRPYIESVSLQDAHAALLESWSKDHRLVLLTGNAKIGEQDPPKTILETYQKSKVRKVSAYEGFVSKKFPYLEPRASLSKLVKRENNVKDLGITRVDFQNNVRLNLKKTDYKHNEFIFKVCFGKGRASQPLSKPGLDIVSQSVVQKSGLGRIDNDQLEEALAGKNIGFGFSIKDNYFSFSGSADPKEAELIFQLMYHYLNDPGYRPEALTLAKTRYKQAFEGLLRTPEGIMQIKGDAFLAEDDTRFGLPDPDTVNQYTLEDIRSWLTPYFKTAPVEVSLVGDFDVETMIRLSSKYLGALEKRNQFKTEMVSREKIFFPEGQTLELNVKSKIDKGVVHVAFLTDDFWDIMQTRKLSILSRVFSERLRIVIREELGETYSPYVYNDPSMRFDNYGILHVVVNINPEKAELVYSKIKEIIHSLTVDGISTKETALSLKPVLNHLKILRKTNAYWLNSVLANSSTYPEKFEWARNMTKGYGSITGTDLSLLAKKYLDMDKSALIIISSGKK